MTTQDITLATLPNLFVQNSAGASTSIKPAGLTTPVPNTPAQILAANSTTLALSWVTNPGLVANLSFDSTLSNPLTIKTPSAGVQTISTNNVPTGNNNYLCANNTWNTPAAPVRKVNSGLWSLSFPGGGQINNSISPLPSNQITNRWNNIGVTVTNIQIPNNIAQFAIPSGTYECTLTFQLAFNGSRPNDAATGAYFVFADSMGTLPIAYNNFAYGHGLVAYIVFANQFRSADQLTNSVTAILDLGAATNFYPYIYSQNGTGLFLSSTISSIYLEKLS